MASKMQRQEISAKRKLQRYRLKYKKVMEKYRGHMTWCDYEPSSFTSMIADLLKLNIKYQQQLLSDLRSGYIPPWSGEYHRMLQHSIELNILERTVLSE